MQEIERIHPGACVYTISSSGQYKNCVMYMSNFSVVLFQLEPFKYIGSIQAPYDMQLKLGQERSGLSAIAVNTTGQLAICTRLGTLLIYDLPQIDQPVKSISLDYKKVNQSIDNRASSNMQVQIMKYHPLHPNILFAYEQYSKEIMVLNTSNCRIFSISTPDYINAMQIIDDYLLIGSALEGSYQVLDGLNEFLSPIFKENEQAKTKVSFKYIFQERLISSTVAKDTIFTTSPLQWYNINYETCFGIEKNQTAQAEIGVQALSCWYGGTLRLHGLYQQKQQSQFADPAQLLGERKISDVICATFVAGSHGNVVLGTKSGKLVFCSLGALLKQKKTFFNDKKLDRELEKIFDNETLTDAEITKQIIVSRFGQIITVNSCQINVKNQNKVFVYGIVSSGGFYVYDCTANTIVSDGAACGHTESIFSLKFHPTIPDVFSTASSDATVKVWRKTAEGIELEQQFGQTGYTSQSRNGQQKFVFKNNNQAKSGGQIDSQALTGPILSTAWDPRENSCLMVIGSWRGSVAVCDVWRSSVYASLPAHDGKVHDAAWGMIPGLSKQLSLICTVGSDGVGRIYGVDHPLRIGGGDDGSAEVGSSQASGIGGAKLTMQRLETNFVEFANNKEVGIVGCAFSPHEALLATSCRDGYVRVYDLRPFDPDDTIAKERLKVINDKVTLRRPIQIGKFSVAQKPLFHITFHPTMRNVLALTGDSGEVRIYRYEYDGVTNFKVQCASVLLGHSSASRPLHFSVEVPQVLFTGSWDGSVIAWNWVHNIQLAKFQMGSDVYGLGGQPSTAMKGRFGGGGGLEVYVSSRDLSIRRLFLASVAQQLTCRLVFLPLARLVGGGRAGAASSAAEIVRRGLRGAKSEILTKELRNAIASCVQTASHRKMREEPPENFILSGKASENLLITLNDDSEALEVIASVVNITFPAAGGATELLRTVLYFQQNHNMDLYVDDILHDKVAYQEHENACNGLVLSARSLQHLAAMTGLHYMRALFGLFEGRVVEEFKQKKYGFYQFQRRLPNVKAEAYKYQFKVGLMMLAASGLYEETAQILKMIDAPERVFYENLCLDALNEQENESEVAELGENATGQTIGPTSGITGALPGELWARMRYATCLSQMERQVIAAAGIYQASGDDTVIRELLPNLCNENLHCIAKMLAYQIKSEPLIRWVSRELARGFLAAGKAVRAALELCSTQQVDLASRILCLAGEPQLAALLSMASPEEGFTMGLVGAAESCYKNGLDPGTLLALARGSSQSAPKASPYTAFLTMQHVQQQFRQLCTYEATFSESYLTQSQVIEQNQPHLADLINAGGSTVKTGQQDTSGIPTINSTISKLLSLQPDRFYSEMLNFMEPNTLQALMAHLGGETIEEQFSKANVCLLAIVNKYVKIKGMKPYLFTLYNLFRYKTLGLNDIVYEGAFYSNYLAAKYAADTLKLDQLAAFLYSQAEKIQTKFNVCNEISGIKLLKLEAVYNYSGKNELVKAKILQIDPKWQEKTQEDEDKVDTSFDDAKDGELDMEENITQICHDMDVFLTGAIGAQKLRSLLSPFNIKLQAQLNFCPTVGE